MALRSKFQRLYFNYAYNPVYDFTTARHNRYRKLQEECIGKLELRDKDRVLCVGLGTGNEILRILGINPNVSIMGVDYSHTALQKAYKKALSLGKEIEVRVMDARRLELPAASFDKVLCLHVMDFIEDNTKAAIEILRVLKDRGQYVITYPSSKEGVRLGLNIFKDNIHNRSPGESRIRALLETLAQMLVGMVYIPLLFRPKHKSYSYRELEGMFSQLAAGDFQIEEDVIYQDFIVSGRK